MPPPLCPPLVWGDGHGDAGLLRRVGGPAYLLLHSPKSWKGATHRAAVMEALGGCHPPRCSHGSAKKLSGGVGLDANPLGLDDDLRFGFESGDVPGPWCALGAASGVRLKFGRRAKSGRTTVNTVRPSLWPVNCLSPAHDTCPS